MGNEMSSSAMDSILFLKTCRLYDKAIAQIENSMFKTAYPIRFGVK